MSSQASTYKILITRHENLLACKIQSTLVITALDITAYFVNGRNFMGEIYIHVNLFNITAYLLSGTGGDFQKQTCILPLKLTCYNGKTSLTKNCCYDLFTLQNENNYKNSFICCCHLISFMQYY